jgi:hypothetical protein
MDIIVRLAAAEHRDYQVGPFEAIGQELRYANPGCRYVINLVGSDAAAFQHLANDTRVN